LTTLGPGSWEVPVRSLGRRQDLEKIMSIELRRYSPLSVGSDPSLGGGLVLLDNHRVIIEFGSGGILASHREWLAAARCTASRWEEILIGQATLPVRFVDGWLEFSAPDDSRAPAPDYRVRPVDLKAAVLESVAELEKFSARVLEVLRTWPGLKEVEALARHLAGLGEK